VYDDEEPHIPKDHFSFDVSWMANSLDLVAHKGLQKHMDSQARNQAQFYILQRARLGLIL
jgi:hypothetical protein